MTDPLSEFRLDDQVAVVVGGGNGIGRAIAEAYAGIGAIVAVADSDRESARGVAAAITQAGGRAEAHALDVTDAAEIERVFGEIGRENGRFDVLVNSAGVAVREPATEVTPADCPGRVHTWQDNRRRIPAGGDRQQGRDHGPFRQKQSRERGLAHARGHAQRQSGRRGCWSEDAGDPAPPWSIRKNLCGRRNPMQAMSAQLSDVGHAHQVVGDTTLFDVVFTETPVRNYRDVVQGDKQKAAAFNAGLRRHGILKPPGMVYMSMALTGADMAQTIEAVGAAAREI